MKFKVSEKAMRPASDKRQCFYCRSKIGDNHKDDCVLVIKKVKVKFSVEYEAEVPSSWGKEDVEFHRNESSWCADNVIAELKAICESSEVPCLCFVSETEYLGDISESYLREE